MDGVYRYVIEYRRMRNPYYFALKEVRGTFIVQL